MREEKLLTIRDVSIILGISERQVMDLAESGHIPAYKVGGVYLRFRREQIDELRKKYAASLKKDHPKEDYSFREKLGDFLYFNDFYILSAILIILILIVIFRGY